jgi:hypothetical protein
MQSDNRYYFDYEIDMNSSLIKISKSLLDNTKDQLHFHKNVHKDDKCTRMGKGIDDL